MRNDTFTLETALRLHLASSPELQEAGLRAWTSALMGAPVLDEEPLYILADLAREIRTHQSWLHRLEIQKHCGERFAGRFRYRKSRVLAYLQSPECQERINTLHDLRKRRDERKTASQ
jgi:hypothetical protein